MPEYHLTQSTPEALRNCTISIRMRFTTLQSCQHCHGCRMSCTWCSLPALGYIFGQQRHRLGYLLPGLYLLRPTLEVLLCPALQFRVVQVLLDHLPTQVADNPIQNIMAPWVGFSAAMQIAILVVFLEFLHHIVSGQAERLGSGLAHDRHKLREVWCVAVTVPAPLHAGGNSLVNLLLSKSCNRLFPE